MTRSKSVRKGKYNERKVVKILESLTGIKFRRNYMGGSGSHTTRLSRSGETFDPKYVGDIVPVDKDINFVIEVKTIPYDNILRYLKTKKFIKHWEQAINNDPTYTKTPILICVYKDNIYFVMTNNLILDFKCGIIYNGILVIPYIKENYEAIQEVLLKPKFRYAI